MLSVDKSTGLSVWMKHRVPTERWMLKPDPHETPIMTNLDNMLGNKNHGEMAYTRPYDVFMGESHVLELAFEKFIQLQGGE